MTFHNLIESALAKAKEAEEAEQRKRKKHQDEQIALLKRAIQPVLEELKLAGATFEEAECGIRNNERDVDYYQVPLLLPGYGRFWLVATPHGPDMCHVFWENHSHANREYMGNNHDLVQLQDEVGFGNFLLRRKTAYEKAEEQRRLKQAELRKKEADDLAQRLNNQHRSDFPTTAEAVEAILSQIAELAPGGYDIAGLRSVWQTNFNLYQQRLEQQRLDDEQAAEHKRRYAEKLEEFKAAWQRFVENREHLWQINRARLAPLQEKYNQPFEVYELCYALYVPALDEDGPYAEKESCDCLWPYLNGFHREIGRNGVIRPYRYSDSHVYKIGMEREVQPVSYKNAGRYQLMDLLGEDVALRYVPGTDPEEIAAAVRQTFEPIPAEPQPDPMLSYNDVKRIQRGQEPEDELLF
ncbi:MAG: hypothetical protein HS126_22140 [Anaerolineales bacterium]|nr:hypothetical protein [Anaerolineales bacterium]